MKKQGGGRIVNIASVDGIKPEPGVSIYDVSKAGVRMITYAFALELAPFNIRVNTIAPGPISTNCWIHTGPTPGGGIQKRETGIGGEDPHETHRRTR